MSVNEIIFAGSQWFKAGKLPKQVTAKANWTILHNVKYYNVNYGGSYSLLDFQLVSDITLDVIGQTGDQYQVISKSSANVAVYSEGMASHPIHISLNLQPFNVDKGSVIPIWGVKPS